MTVLLSRPATAPVRSDETAPHRFPALDGLRGAAVLAVLLFHAGVLPGGFLGVSTFFTLSGFLITSLLLHEHRRTGSVDLRRFWSARARRLVPAALATLALVVATAPLQTADQRRHLGGDVLASLGQVANWRFVVAGRAYTSLFETPSPLLHLWSLAIETQLYVVVPLLVVLLAQSRRTLLGVLLALAAISAALPSVAGLDQDRTYLGTDTRAAELLLGAVLAVVLPRLRLGRGTALLGTGALGLLVVAWTTTSLASGWVYAGGLAGYAVVSTVVVAAGVQPRGAVTRALAWPPLAALGRISYGVYLYHWPLYGLLDQERTGLTGIPLLVLRLVVTMLVATASYHWLELPVRRGRGSWLTGAVATAAIAGFAVFVSSTGPAPATDVVSGARRLEVLTEQAPRPTTPAPVVVPGASLPPLPARPRTALFGDSTALQTGIGLGDVLTETRAAQPVGGYAELGCGLTRGGRRQVAPKFIDEVPTRCDSWHRDWQRTVDRLRPDVAIVQFGLWDADLRRLPGDVWRAPGDPTYDAVVRREVERAISILTSRGGRVVWLTNPHVNYNAVHSDQPVQDLLGHPERVDRINEIVRDVAGEHPATVAVVDLGGRLQDGGNDLRLRPDGVHLSDRAAVEVARRWLAGAVIEAARGLG